MKFGTIAAPTRSAGARAHVARRRSCAEEGARGCPPPTSPRSPRPATPPWWRADRRRRASRGHRGRPGFATALAARTQARRHQTTGRPTCTRMRGPGLVSSDSGRRSPPPTRSTGDFTVATCPAFAPVRAGDIDRDGQDHPVRLSDGRGRRGVAAAHEAVATRAVARWRARPRAHPVSPIPRPRSSTRGRDHRMRMARCGGELVDEMRVAHEAGAVASAIRWFAGAGLRSDPRCARRRSAIMGFAADGHPIGARARRR